jgi:hypothetical protein
VARAPDRSSRSGHVSGTMDFVDGLKSIAGKAEVGDMTFVSRMLATQAVALGTIFGEFTRRRTRQGGACQSPAVKGRKRCRMHGGTNPGEPKGNRNAWKHGARSEETVRISRLLGQIQPKSQDQLKS